MSIERDESIPILPAVIQLSQQMIRLSQQMIQAVGSRFRLNAPRFVFGFGISFLIVVVGFGLVEGQLAAAKPVPVVKLSVVRPHGRPPSKKLAGDRTQTDHPQLGHHQNFESSATNRLKQGDLTGAALTRNRLTGSHLFVDAPATPQAQHQ